MKQRGKRGLCLILSFLVLCGLFGCGTEREPDRQTSPTEQTPTTDPAHDPNAAEEPTEPSDPSGATEPTEETDDHLYQVAVTGLVPDDPASASANTLALCAAISSAKESTTLLVGEGCFFFSSVSYFGNRFTLTVSGKKDLTIRGEVGKTTFVNTSYSPKERCNPDTYMASNLWLITGSEDITIAGIAFDYLSPTNLSAEVAEVSASGNYTILRPLDANDGVTGGEYVFCVNLFTSEGKPKSEAWMESGNPIALIA